MKDPAFQRRLRETFRAEATEHLHEISAGLFALEKSADVEAHAAIIETIFRLTHTLKGAARLVGEEDAEALCQALEHRLGLLKQAKKKVPPGTIAELHAELTRLSAMLNFGEDAIGVVGSKTAPTAVEAAMTVAARGPAGAGLVRVPSARLDALLVHAEELLTAKLTGAQRVAALRAIEEREAVWKKEWARIRKEMVAARRFIDAGLPSPVTRELKALVHFLDWNHEFVERWQDELAQVSRAARQDERRLGTMVDHLLGETKEVLMLPFDSLLEIFPSFVREAALSQGKEIDLVLEGGKTEIDRRVLEEIKDAIVHLVRNAVDHGLGTPAERRAAGKASRGTLTIAVTQKSGGDVEIVVADDGRGVDAAKVTAHARRLKLIGEDVEELSEGDALGLLFESGFSTSSTVTELSGRGLGLAIVREKAEQIGGSVAIESELGRGTTFRLQLPITLARFRGIFVMAQSRPFVIPAAHVRRVIRLDSGRIKRVKNQDTFDFEGASIVLVKLSEILGIPAVGKQMAQSGSVFVVMLSVGRSRVALRVDGVPYEQEIVMKGLGRLLARMRHFMGATIVGGGQIVPVLNATGLVGSAIRRGGARRAQPGRAAPAVARKRKILIAEDSITSRTLIKSILQGAGFEVRTAVDGADALTTLKFEPPDLLISDVQMPRLDGFELTAKIRADKDLSTLPVILITSLASREDKARGVDAGANAYIVKSSFDQSDLLEAIGRLLA
ncbi:MAG: response regulator [Verrucomicrobiota bacterium]